MKDKTDFFSRAFYKIARAIAEAGVNVDLFKTPETIAKSLNRRVRAALKRLAVLLRRLIFLVALQMELAPSKPRTGSNYFEPARPRPHLPPIPHTHRMPAALALISGGLTVQLIEALKRGPDADMS